MPKLENSASSSLGICYDFFGRIFSILVNYSTLADGCHVTQRWPFSPFKPIFLRSLSEFDLFARGIVTAGISDTAGNESNGGIPEHSKHGSALAFCGVHS